MSENKKVAGSPGSSSVAAEIQSRMEEIIAAAQNADVEGTFSYLTRDPGALFFQGNQQLNRDSLIALFRENYRDMKSQKIQVVHSEVLQTGPESGVWIAYGEGMLEMKTGGPKPYTFTETWVWQKVRGKWTVTHYHESA
ncbi:MAG: nuclear transport factor 2 family protein [Methanoregulaceae archaeon]|nr:nuclear transport factor 2 family protein [Methanoregulaceae archaeon]